MTNPNTKAYKQYVMSCENLVKRFCDQYFDNTEDYYFIGNEPDGVVGISDYFFSVSDIAKFLKHDATEDEVFGYYDYQIDQEGKGINLENWLKSERVNSSLK